MSSANSSAPEHSDDELSAVSENDEEIKKENWKIDNWLTFWCLKGHQN